MMVRASSAPGFERLLSPRCQLEETLPLAADLSGTAVHRRFVFEVNVSQATGLTAKFFATFVSVSGSAVLVYSIYRLHLNPVRLDWMLVLAFTMLLCWRAEVLIPGVHSKITLSDVFICIAILLLGPWAAAALASIDGLARSARGSGKNLGASAMI